MHERQKTTRITDLFFLGWVVLGLLYVILAAKEIVPLWDGATWVLIGILGVLALIKTFFPRTRFVKWMEKARW